MTYLEGVVAALREKRLHPAPPPEHPLSDTALMRSLLPDGCAVVLQSPSGPDHLVGLVVDQDGRATAALKTPRRPGNDDRLLDEAGLLDRAAAVGPGLAGSVPRQLACLQWGERLVLVETAVAGAPLSTRAAKRGADSALLRWISALPITGETSGATLLDTLLEPGLRRLESVLPAGHELVATIAATRESVAVLRTRSMPTVLEHADLAPAHVLVDGEGRDLAIGVVGWGSGREHGAPGHDAARAASFLAVSRAATTANRVDVVARDVIAPGSVGRAEVVETLPSALPSDSAGALLVLAFARHAIRRLPHDDVERVLRLLKTSEHVELWRRAAAPRG